MEEEKKLVENISQTEVKNVLVKHGIEWRNSKTVLGKSRDPEYELKKRIEQIRYNTPPASILLHQDEKGPIAAKTYMAVNLGVLYTNEDRKSPKDKRNSQYIWCLRLYK